MAMSTGGGPGGNRNTSLDKADVGENWPLISYLLADPVYYDMYLGYLADTVARPFNTDQMAEKYQAMAYLIAPYAIVDVGEDVFETAVQQLINHAYQRADEVTVFLVTNIQSD